MFVGKEGGQPLSFFVSHKSISAVISSKEDPFNYIMKQTPKSRNECLKVILRLIS
jgi:hypothetical protein